MADIERTVKVAFLGEDRVTKTIDTITGRVDSFAGRVSDATQPLANLTDNILKVEGALAALAVGGLALAYREFISFESAATELAKVLDDQTESIDDAKIKALELSATYGQSSQTILASFANFRQAGFDLAESMSLTKDALDLAISGDMELAQASEIVVATLKGFGAEAGTARDIIDSLNEVSNNYATSSQELGTGLALLSPIAKQMGLSFQETISLLTPIIEVFRSGSEAGNAMKTVLLKLTDDAKPVQEALTALGVSQKDANGQFRAGKDILYDVLAAFQTLAPEEKAYYAQQLSGIFQAGKAVTVFDNLSKVLEIQKVQTEAAGSAWAEVQKRLETAELQVDRFIVAIKNLGSATGAELSDSFTRMISGGTEVINTFRQLIDQGVFDELFGLVDNVANQIGDTLFAIAENLPDAMGQVDFSGFIASIEGIIDEVVNLFGSFFGDIDLKSKEGLEQFIQRVVDSFASLNNITIGILKAFGPFVTKVGELAEKFADLDSDTAETVGQFLGWGKVINTLAENVSKLTGSLNFLVQAVTWFTGVKMISAIKNLGQMGTAGVGLTGALVKLQAAGLALTVGWTFGTWLSNTFPQVEKFGTALADMALGLVGLSDKQIRAIEDEARHTKALGDLNVALVKAVETIEGVPDEKYTDFGVKGSDTYNSELAKMVEYVKSVPETKTTQVQADVDKESVKKTTDYIDVWVSGLESPTGEPYSFQVAVERDPESFEKTEEKLDEITSEKIIIAKIENQTELEIAKINASAATLQSAFEWKAKIDIAETEQLFETLRGQAEAISAEFTSSGEVIQSWADIFSDAGALGQSDLIALMEREVGIREELARQQGLLVEKEAEYLDAKTSALKQGNALINIQMDGVYPELEAIMYKIIERTQVTATAEGLDFLIGT